MKQSALVILLAGLVLLAGLGFAVVSISHPAPVDARAMTAANELVAAGHYAEAAQMYEKMITQGAQDAALYYNLGNASLALGDAVRALTAYEQAAALAPRDADIRANLALAQQRARTPANQAVTQQAPRAKLAVAHQQALGPISRPSAGSLGGLADVTGRWLTIDELALLALSGWLALGLSVFAYRELHPERRPAVLPVAPGLPAARLLPARLLRVGMAAALLVVLATGGVLASRMAALRLAAPATTAGQPPAEDWG